MKKFAVVLALALSFTLPVLADDEGHHHEELTPEQLGTVHFPVSCAPEVQKPFERGVALLHSFWYEEAQKEFEDISRQDQIGRASCRERAETTVGDAFC